MIAHLQRASDTAGLLASLYGPGEDGDHADPRLVAGDGHGAPIDMLATADTLPYLAHALDAPVQRLGTRAPEQPVWVCSVRSDPRRPDLTDAQWNAVARRLVAATGLASEGDPDACRWIALRSEPRLLHVVATVAREDGSLHHSYSDAFRLQTECHRIATELGHLPQPATPTSRAQENLVAPRITIHTEASGSVSAKGASDDLSATLLKHAGFQQIGDWYGRRHRLPTTTPAADRAAIATHAAEMLRAARYTVDLEPVLDTGRLAAAANPLGPYAAGAEVLQLTERIRGAESGADLAQAVDHLLHPEHGVLERVREALEAASEQISDLDDEAYALADRFGFAADFVSSAQSELVGSEAELPRVGASQRSHVEERAFSPLPGSRGAALATSPAAAKARASSALGTGMPEVRAAVSLSQGSLPRSR
ncbi:hypothetical protein OIB37_11060 [Streptomyces sp. NBC_00820]|uniref:hypothetical protein n=1 Tax=Streptomyces sp. NBC_00820 TaxID=2975842 RepID=UPI002ED54E26|nr:hypothetical protein OIB37_11060 [Streptomyces sp. NBC_00820]